MQTNSHKARRILCGAQVLVAGAAIATFMAPSAAASVTSIGLEPGVMDGFQVIAGKNYWFAVYTFDLGSGGQSVQVSDNGQCFGSPIAGTGTQNPLSNYSYINWQPATAGSHTIVARQGSSSKSITVNVVAAAPGSTPDPQQTNPSCAATGPATGSSGS